MPDRREPWDCFSSTFFFFSFFGNFISISILIVSFPNAACGKHTCVFMASYIGCC